MPSCCVKECKHRSHTSTKADGVTFHLFPKDETKRKKWIDAIHREEWNPSRASVVCSKHFHRSCFYYTRGGLVRLLHDAVPSLLLNTSENETTETIQQHPLEQELSEKLSVLRRPVVADDDPPEAHRLAGEILRLLHACKTQRRCIRTLQKQLKQAMLKQS